MKTKKLFDKEYYLHAGKCRMCGTVKLQKIRRSSVTWSAVAEVCEKEFAFWKDCESCGNYAVFDVLAISSPADRQEGDLNDDEIEDWEELCI